MVKVEYLGKGAFYGKLSFKPKQTRDIPKDYADYLIKNFPSFFKFRKVEKKEVKKELGKGDKK